MANDIYIITPTDGNSSREFNVSPYSANGYTTPISAILDPTAVEANSSLLFHGKGSDGYGERLQENFYHLLENFSSYSMPLQPVQGQLWFDNNDNTLKIFQARGLDIYDIYNNAVIVRLNGNFSSKYFQLNKAALLLKFQPGFQFNIYSADTYDKINNYIVLSASVDTGTTGYIVPNGNDTGKLISLSLNSLIDIETPVTPGTSDIKQHIGTWVPVFNTSKEILDSVEATPATLYSSLYGNIVDLDIGENKIVNLADPVSNLDGVNLQYVNSNYLSNLGGTLNGNLVINGTLDISTTGSINMNSSSIIGLADPINNQDATTKNYVDSNFVNLGGSTMTGTLVLNGDPINLLEAATKQYVDSAVLGGSLFLTLLNDVTITTPVDGQSLIYDGNINEWVNSTLSLTTLNGFTDTDFIKTSVGGSISASGILKLNGQPGQNGVIGTTAPEDAVTVGHLDTTISSIPGSSDTFLSSAIYDTNTDDLTLTLSNSVDILVNNIGTNILSSQGDIFLNHEIIPEININSVGNFLESNFINDVNYPNISTNLVLNAISEEIKNIIKPNKSNIVISDNRVTPYIISDNYVVGYNNLMVYINGIKQTANTKGFQKIFRTTSPYVYPSAPIGLNIANTYTFNISVDSNPNQLISINGNVAQNYAELIDEINSQFSLNGVLANANIIDSEFYIFSDSSGALSNISITDIDLFSTIGNITIDSSIPGIDYDYSEIGKYGSLDNTVLFNTQIPTSNRLEFMIIASGNNSDINTY